MSPTDRVLVQAWYAQTELCRGVEGGQPATRRVCDWRDETDRLLRLGGWCYGLPDDYGYQRYWRRCLAERER